MLRLHMLILTALALVTFMVATPSANAQNAPSQGAGVTGNPLQDWTVVNGNAGAAGNISLNVFHFFMWALMGVITIFGIKSCIAAASSGQTQQLWPRIMATVLGLAIPFFVNWITTAAGN
jgi:hypothetical protein